MNPDPSTHDEPPVGFDPDFDAAFSLPDRAVPSAWTHHAPFALWLVAAHRPRTIVELGTHHGMSYFAMCQAVVTGALDTRCYAIDTWQGDEHAGYYGEDVYEAVSRINDQYYASFSRLVRSSFDDAVSSFADGSIDLLHLDGRHFYEDVVHDFRTWLPKLSDKAIVLFHDTNVRERSFGVARAWNELRRDHVASVEFLHGHGLGILQVGDRVNPVMDSWFRKYQHPQNLIVLRSRYARLGQAAVDSLTSDELRSRLATIEDQLAVTRTEATTAREEQDRVTAQLEHEREARRKCSAEQEQALADAKLQCEQALASAVSRYERLRSRRSVRASLALARLMRPVFRVVRRRNA